MSIETGNKFVTIEGYGEFEIREPAFEDIEVLFTGENEATSKFSIDLLKKCLYKDGELVFSKKVGAKLGMKLFALAPDVLEMCGFDAGEAGKDQASASPN